jgi:hypothetical protein
MMITQDPKRRCTAAQALKHEFFNAMPQELKEAGDEAKFNSSNKVM